MRPRWRIGSIATRRVVWCSGRHRKALAELGRLFKQGKVGKTYWAVVEGGPAEDEGRIDLALGRLDESRGWWMKPDPHGQPAATTWKVLGRCARPASSTVSTQGMDSAAAVPSPACGGGLGRGQATGIDASSIPLPTPPPAKGRSRPSSTGYAGEGADLPRGATGAQSLTSESHLTWLALEPLTGRTHQLRVHCAAMGWPILGDTIYGTQASLRRLRKEALPRSGGPGLHLHSREIVVPLYKNRAPVAVSAPVPLHMHATLQACGWQGEVFRLVD